MGMLAVNEFDAGLDVRKSASTAPASTLRVLTNAYITTGKSIKKRPGLLLRTTLSAGTRGLIAGNGILHTFYDSLTTIAHPDAFFAAHQLTPVGAAIMPAAAPTGTAAQQATAEQAAATASVATLTTQLAAASADIPVKTAALTAAQASPYNVGNIATGGGAIPQVYLDAWAAVTAANTALTVAISARDALVAALAAANTRLTTANAAVTAGIAAVQMTQMTLDPLAAAAPALAGIDFAQSINGYLYIVADYDNRFVQHHYLDGYVTAPLPPSTFNIPIIGAFGGIIGYTSGTIPGAVSRPDTRVLDINCPHSDIVTYGASKLYCGLGQDVAFCSVGNPRNWQAQTSASSTNTGGFLPVGRQQSSGSINVSALGMFKGMLMVFFNDTVQMWVVDVNPANDKKLDTLGVGCVNKLSVANMVNDLFFLSSSGVRSITRSTTIAGNWQDFDIGSQIDKIISEVRGNDAIGDYTKANYLTSLGQYWIWKASGTKTVAYVFSFSQSAGISAWSRYEFNLPFDAMTELGGVVYIRSGDAVYQLDAASYTDNGAPITVSLETAFVDMQCPQDLKQLYGLDYVVQGTAALQFKYDPRDATLITQPITISGDSRPGALDPVELCSTHAALVFTHAANEPFELSDFVLHFNRLGQM